MSVPWPVIISALPALLDTAARLFKRADKPPLPAIPASNAEDQLKAVIARLEYFESLEADQAKLIRQTLEQLQNVTVALSAASRRANLALGIAATAILVAAGTLLVNFVG